MTQRRVGIALASLAGLAVVAVVAWFIVIYINTREPAEGRVCECDLLTEWTEDLPLNPDGDRLDTVEIIVEEGTNGFFITARQTTPATNILESLRIALADHGVNHKVEENPDPPRSMRIPRAIDSEAPGHSVFRWQGTKSISGSGVTVDGSRWGLERAEDLHRLYLDDSAFAITAQEERQQRAIEILQPLKDALREWSRTADAVVLNVRRHDCGSGT